MVKALSDVRTLIVDDVRAPREVLRRLLVEIGISQVQEATHGKDALLKLGMTEDTSTESSGPTESNGPTAIHLEPSITKDSFQLILCDFHLPDFSGLELLRKVRNDPHLHNIPFVMITSELDRTEALESKRSGVTAFILKPFSLEIVRNTIERALHTQ